MNEQEWLAGLKEGDEVFVLNDGGLCRRHVSATTKTIIVVGKMSETGYTQEIRFSRKSGKQGGGGWGARYLVMPTDEGRVQVNMNILTGKARNLLNSVVIPKSVDKLKEFIDEMAKWQNV